MGQQQVSEFYGNGAELPTLHPDPEINRELQVEYLCGQLDVARKTLGKVSSMQVITPRLVQLKHDVLWALDATHPKVLCEQHANCG